MLPQMTAVEVLCYQRVREALQALILRHQLGAPNGYTLMVSFILLLAERCVQQGMTPPTLIEEVRQTLLEALATEPETGLLQVAALTPAQCRAQAKLQAVKGALDQTTLALSETLQQHDLGLETAWRIGVQLMGDVLLVFAQMVPRAEVSRMVIGELVPQLEAYLKHA